MDKKSYYVNVIEAKDGKMGEVMNFNFGGHHDLGDMAEKARQAGWFVKDKHAKEFVLAMRFMHHVMKKNPDAQIFKDFAELKEIVNARDSGRMKAYLDRVRENLR